MISHLGPQLGVADGIALATTKEKRKITAVLLVKVLPLKEIFTKLEYCFCLGIAVLCY
jgi:hypothetical protein